MTDLVRIQYQVGDSVGTLQRCLNEHLERRSDPPRCALIEPLSTYCHGGKTGRIPGFQPFCIGTPTWPAGVPVTEVRVFWPDAALHLVSSPGHGNYRWAWIIEDETCGTRCRRSSSPVLLLRDAARFGLEPGQWREHALNVIEYHQRAHRVGWRLELAAKGERT